MNAVVKRTEVDALKAQVANREGDFKMALPAHLPVERFMRVVNTAVTGNPDLLKADRASLFQSAMKAAQDGLLPDGRDGALVVFGGRVQWMPMIAGILKKVRNSGELLSISAYVAYSNDEFTYELGDEEKIIHKPSLDDRGRPRLAYAIAKTKDGGIYREVMTVAEVEKVRAVSKAKNAGPWKDWWDEMARKTVLRRLAKRLPMSTDLDDLVRRDDALYDFDGAREQAQDEISRPKTLAGRLDALAEADPETGEVIEHDAGESPAEETDAGQPKQPAPQEAAAEAAGGKPGPNANASGAAAAEPDDGTRVGDERLRVEDERLRVEDDRSRAAGDPFAGKSSAWREGWSAAERGAPKDRPPAHIADDDELADFRDGFEAWWAQHESAGRKTRAK
ncbi:MAG: recombinase RecT [Methylocystis sp.]|uniref:recombinase RecT n=1 Tax=Methylocystis sp. TaxID=1911079 RepID=UPI003D0C7FB4